MTDAVEDGGGKLQEQVQQEIAGHMWHAGTQSAKNFVDMYGQLDYLRPYFNVEPIVVCKRLARSLVPSSKINSPQDAPNELYGPVMIIFSLVAILLLGMKTSEHTVKEGTLIGTALAACFGYWFFAALILTFVAYLLNSALNFLQVLSLTGYCLFGHCCCFLVAIVCTAIGSSTLFYIFSAIFVGLSSLKMTGVYVSRSWSHQNGCVLSAIAIVFHVGFLLYLKLAYHKVYEALA